MADNDKKGPRDISNLKERLGLKKQGGPPAPGPGGPAAPGPGPAPAPPPGLRPTAVQLPTALTGMPAPGAVPPPGGFPAPPGYVPPPEAAPPPPDPRRDPFAAQQMAVAANLREFYTGGQLPGDANSVQADAIPQRKPWAVIGGAVGLTAVMFLVGYGCGSISVGRNRFNETTDQAVNVRNEVETIQKQVGTVYSAVKEIKLSEREPPNFDAVKKLGDIEFREPDLSRNLFHTNYADFEPETVRALFSYYNDVVVLSKQITEHASKTGKDREAIEKYTKNTAARTDKSLGVILDLTQSVPQATLVELGNLVCPTPGQTDCPPAEAKFRFRSSVGGEFAMRPLKGKPENAVFPIAPTDLQKQVMSGDPNLIAFRQFASRQVAILDTLRRLAEEDKQVIGNLKKRAEQAKLFTLF